MPEFDYGKVVGGSEEVLRRSVELWTAQPIDMDLLDEPAAVAEPAGETTLAVPAVVSGVGTFLGSARRTVVLEPMKWKGWWFNRMDLPEAMPIHVTISNVWNTTWNIVLCGGSPRNYMRMVEHIIALKTGLRLDNVMARIESGDPPLFDRGSADLVEAVAKAGIVERDEPAKWVCVKEPVTVCGENGGFLTFLPPESGRRELLIDCAIDFKSAIGRQRIRFRVNRETFARGASARTNTTVAKMVYCKTIGRILADVRNLGYTTKNILIAGRRRYYNEPRMFHNGKSLEAVWHRAALDLMAAISLIDRGRFAGKVVSYKSGHRLDIQMVRALYKQDLLEDM